jgi:hypothetical protein
MLPNGLTISAVWGRLSGKRSKRGACHEIAGH